MMELIYTVLFAFTVLQLLLFFILSVASLQYPGFRSRLLSKLGVNRKTSIFIILQMLLITISVIFFFDSHRKILRYQDQYDFLIHHKVEHSFLRKAEIDYKILMTQRNIYIPILCALITIALNVYIILFKRISKTRTLITAKLQSAKQAPLPDQQPPKQPS